MSCKSCNSSSSACCQPSKLVVDEFCQIFEVEQNPVQVLWRDSGPQQIISTISVNRDASYAANVVISFAIGCNLCFTLQPGESRTDSLVNAVSISVSSISASGTTIGKSCITVYRKFY